MLPIILLLTASAVGINYGWEPLPEGGMKYIVQFKPETLIEAQKAGFDLESNIPSNVGDVRALAFRSGTGPARRSCRRELGSAQTRARAGLVQGS